MGIWSATLFGSGGAIQWQRWQGTLELMVGAPPPFVAILLPLTVATSTIGIYSVVATLAWGRIFFGTPLDFAHPLQLAVALPATILSLGCSGCCSPRRSSSTGRRARSRTSSSTRSGSPRASSCPCRCCPGG